MLYCLLVADNTRGLDLGQFCGATQRPLPESCFSDFTLTLVAPKSQLVELPARRLFQVRNPLPPKWLCPCLSAIGDLDHGPSLLRVSVYFQGADALRPMCDLI